MEQQIFRGTSVQRLPSVQVTAGDWAYFPRIRELCALRFGSGYVDEADFSRWMEHPDLVQIALVNGEFAGMAVLLPASDGEIAGKMGMTQGEVRKITGGRPAVIYKSIALQPQYEKHGLGRNIVLDGLRRAEDKGYCAVFIAAWMYNGLIPAQRMLQSLGFTELYRRKMLWYGDEKYRCIACGGRCVCDGMIYYKRLEA